MGRHIKTMNPQKRAFLALMKKQGFTSINQFSIACGMASGNVHLNLSGVYSLSIERAFRYANVLGVPVTDVIAVFYPDETKANRKAIEEFNLKCK